MYHRVEVVQHTITIRVEMMLQILLQKMDLEQTFLTRKLHLIIIDTEGVYI